MLHGFAASAPTVRVTGGSAQLVTYDAATGYFTVQVSVDPKTPTTLSDGDPVRLFSVALQTKA